MTLGSKVTQDQFGFTWGPATVQRLLSDEKFGVLLLIKSNKESVEIRITPSGIIRVYEATA